MSEPPPVTTPLADPFKITRWPVSAIWSGPALAAFVIGLFLERTNYGRLLRATAENRGMAEALGVNVRSVYAVVFTLGTLLGTIGGALVVPTSAASLDMAVEFVIEAFAVVVIPVDHALAVKAR